MNDERFFRNVLIEAAADYFVEGSILLFIFGILEKIASKEPITIAYGASIITISLLLLVLGCTIRTRG